MILCEKDLKILHSAARDAATAAGKLIAEKAKTQVETKLKDGGTGYASQVVTEVDIASQEVILHRLASCTREYDLGLLTEEHEDDNSRFEKDCFWCIDPLDGTLPFIEKTSGFSVSIALVAKSGEPLLGVIYDPHADVLYEAIKGRSAFRNNAIFEKKESSEIFTLVSDRSMLKQPRFNELYDAVCSIAKEQGCDKVKHISHGGAAMNAMRVTESSPSVYFKLPKKEKGGGSLWDYAASACIASAAGCTVSDIKGEALPLNQVPVFMNESGCIYASNDEIAERVVELGKQFLF